METTMEIVKRLNRLENIKNIKKVLQKYYRKDIGRKLKKVRKVD